MKHYVKTLLLTLVMTMVATTASANSSWNHYSKAVAKAVGEGLVYVSNSPAPNPDFQASSEATNMTNSANDSENHTYYFYAKAKEGHYFDGWYTDASCTQKHSANRTFNVTVGANSGDANKPTMAQYWAKFAKMENTYYSSLTAQAIGGGRVAVSTTKPASLSFKESQSASLKGINPSHRYYLYAQTTGKDRFEGWYADKACKKLLSQDADYAYDATATSVTESEPTQFEVYAKFVQDYQCYTVKNAGFEDWESVDGGEEPVDWSSFLTTSSSGFVANQARKKQLESSTDAHGGSRCAKIWARSVVGIVAQGNVTTGCISAGSMTPSDVSGNYNYTREDQAGQNMRFTGRPDAVKVWIKSKIAGECKVAAILHEKGYYQDPVNPNKECARLVGSAEGAFPTTNGQWQEVTVPFTYATSNASDRPYYILMSFATNKNPGGGASSDEMYIDDITFVYNSSLKQAVYDGKALNFNASRHASVQGAYNAGRMQLTSDGEGASFITSFDEATSVLTITVAGDNISDDPANYHNYTVYFSEGLDQEPVEGPQYVLNFDEDQPVTSATRRLTKVSVAEANSIPVELDIDPDYVYNDLTDVVVEIEPESQMSVTFDYTDSATSSAIWMHSYVYVDQNRNGVFDVEADEIDHIVKGDLVSFSFYSFDDSDDTYGWNSKGEFITGGERAVVQCPSFVAPVKPGKYRTRVKIDWNSIDAGGALGTDGTITGHNSILSNGGYIVDFTLKVIGEDAGIATPIVGSTSTAIYDLQGRVAAKSQKGIFVSGGKKVIR